MTNLEFYKKEIIYSVERRHDELGWVLRQLIEKVEDREVGMEEAIEWLLLECKKPILDNTERRYLSAVIKPFRNKVVFIQKRNFYEGSPERIVIGVESLNYHITKIENHEEIFLPYFEPKTMYRNMKLDKRYTLKELGL